MLAARLSSSAHDSAAVTLHKDLRSPRHLPPRLYIDDVEWDKKWEIGRTGAACLGLYTNNGTVFATATTDWAHGL
jgi:hypothetical protein